MSRQINNNNVVNVTARELGPLSETAELIELTIINGALDANWTYINGPKNVVEPDEHGDGAYDFYYDAVLLNGVRIGTRYVELHANGGTLTRIDTTDAVQAATGARTLYYKAVERRIVPRYNF